jgi:predicted ArsR family transcriptional regulator
MSERPPGELPTELRAFIYSCIDAVEQVEILSLLMASTRPLSARSVASSLGLADASARHHLETLAARGLLQIGTGQELAYGYAPKTPDLRRYGDQLASYYARERTTVLRFIAANPRRLRRFSDAFKLRDQE